MRRKFKQGHVEFFGSIRASSYNCARVRGDAILRDCHAAIVWRREGHLAQPKTVEKLRKTIAKS
jgi:hypothetical protein